MKEQVLIGSEACQARQVSVRKLPCGPVIVNRMFGEMRFHGCSVRREASPVGIAGESGLKTREFHRFPSIVTSSVPLLRPLLGRLMSPIQVPSRLLPGRDSVLQVGTKSRNSMETHWFLRSTRSACCLTVADASHSNSSTGGGRSVSVPRLALDNAGVEAYICYERMLIMNDAETPTLPHPSARPAGSKPFSSGGSRDRRLPASSPEG